MGIFSRSIDRNGEFSVNFRADNASKRSSNAQNAYRGGLKNGANIGIGNQRLKELWTCWNSNPSLTL